MQTTIAIIQFSFIIIYAMIVLWCIILCLNWKKYTHTPRIIDETLFKCYLLCSIYPLMNHINRWTCYLSMYTYVLRTQCVDCFGKYSFIKYIISINCAIINLTKLYVLSLFVSAIVNLKASRIKSDIFNRLNVSWLNSVTFHSKEFNEFVYTNFNAQ